jgi:hypothetical protein
MTSRHVDDDDPHAVRILDPHLGQAPGLCDRLPDDAHPRRGQADVLGVELIDFT